VIDANELDRIEEGREDNKKYLSQLELVTLELLIERIRAHNERLRTLQVGERVRQLESEMLKKNSEIALLEAFKLEQPDRKVVSAKDQLGILITQAQKAKEAFAEELCQKYDIKDPNWGFNPETNEIVEQE
jgi:hypothetical protein